MSDAFPPSPPPPPPPSAPGAAPPTRPGNLHIGPQRARWPGILGAFAIAIGAIGIVFRLGSLLMIILFRSMFVGMDDMDMTTAGPFADHWMAWTVSEYIIGALLAVWLVVAGVALLKRQRWSVPALLLWAWVKIAFVLGESVLAFYMQREQFAAARQQGGAAMPANFDTFAVAASILPMLAIGLAFPIVCLIMLTTAGARREIGMWK